MVSSTLLNGVHPLCYFGPWCYNFLDLNNCFSPLAHFSSSSLSTLSHFTVSFISLPTIELCSFSLFPLSILLVSLSDQRAGTVYVGGRGSWVMVEVMGLGSLVIEIVL